ncbi:MAG: hypothetical protein E7Z92_03010 [Cyanobacteria bacterium SIG31]|nr:hypothetical protein [Cyanobacteria bacterium SIG31]
MAIVIDVNMQRFADKLNITSSRMVRDYGLSTVDEIIEAEAERGNNSAVKYARAYYHSPDKLIKLFKLTDIENKFELLLHMDNSTREKVLPLIKQEDLVMGLNFFTQEKLLKMLMEVDIEELVNVVKEAFPLEQIVLMFTEEDLAGFFMNKKLDRNDVIEQLKILPPEMMQNFIEGVTGQPSYQTDSGELINSIANMPEEQYRKFMASIDPDVQRQLTFQLTKTNPEYLTLFHNETYVNMLSKLMKPEMIKPMIKLSQETLIKIIQELPEDLMSIVAAQIDTRDFAKFLQRGNMEVIEKALLL